MSDQPDREEAKGDPEEKPATGFPEPSGEDPGDRSRDPHPHSALSNPARDPDPTEWPDPYEKRDDPRDPSGADGERPEDAHPQTGAMSTSEPHPSDDPEAGERWEGPKRDKLDR